MSATVSTDFLLLVAHATPEQQAAIERFLRGGLGETLRARGSAAAAQFWFRKAGSHWRVVFDGGSEFHLEDTLGTKYLDYLLHHPNLPISAFDLEIAIQPRKAEVRSRNSIQREADPETTRAYLRALNRLRLEREEAAEAGNLAEVDRLDGEIEVVESALRDGCRASDTGERARSNVNKALAVVRRRLAKGDKEAREFGEHVGRFVSIGYQCMYAQPSGESWE